MIAETKPPGPGPSPPRARFGFLLRIGVFVLITLIALVVASNIIRIATGDKGLVNAHLRERPL
jgi:hypothetical protein